MFHWSRVSVCLVLFSLSGHGSAIMAWPSGEGNSNIPRGIVPLVQHNQHRDVASSVLSPRDSVPLWYTYAEDLNESPAVIAELNAHDGIPIVILENSELEIHDITCLAITPTTDGDTHNMVVTFHSEDIMLSVYGSWSEHDKLVMITLHPTCNKHQERNAWIASKPIIINFQTISFSIRPILLRDAVSSFMVTTFEHAVGGSWNLPGRERAKRDTDADFDNVTSIELSKTLDARQPILSPAITANDSALSALFGSNTDLTITCLDCSFENNFLVGIQFTVDLGDVDCISGNETCISFSAAAFNITVQDFSNRIQLEINLQTQFTAKDIDYTFLSVPATPLEIPGLFSLGPELGLAFRGNIEFSGGINFSVGAEASIPSGAFASFDLLNDKNDTAPTVGATGWEGASLDLIPFNLNSGSLNTSFAVSVSPYVGLGIAVGSFSAAARIYVDTPQISLNAALLTQVTRNCTPPGDQDFELFNAAFSLTTALQLNTIATLVLISGSVNQLHGDLEVPLFQKSLPWFQDVGTCFVLSTDGNSASSGTLVEAATATPSFNIVGIESYYSAHNSELPTGVDYSQMMQVTAVPTNIEQAFQATTSNNGALALGGRSYNVFIFILHSGCVISIFWAF